jgi:hypothetical protein
MAKLKLDEKSHLIWSELSLDDFVQSRSSQNDVLQILEKLAESYSEGKIFMLIYNDTPETSIANIKASDNETLQKIHSHLGGNLQKDILEIHSDSGNLSETGDLLSKRIKEMHA